MPKLDKTYVEEFSAFSEFIAKYGRSYATKNEHMSKFETFRVNYRDIKAHNVLYDSGEVSWSKTINQFTDMTANEFESLYLSSGLRKPDSRRRLEGFKSWPKMPVVEKSF